MKKSRLILILSILSLLGTFIAYFSLPDTIPIHWDISGTPDNFGPKWMTFITGVLPFAFYLLFLFLPKIDPKRSNYEKHSMAYDVTRSATILLLIGLQWITIAIALGIDIKINIVAPLLVAILFIILGNYMPQFRHNYFIGIRTPWTLANEYVWKKTHQLGGYLFIVMGFIFLIQAFLQYAIITYITITLVIGLILFITLYSYLIYKKINK